MFRRIPASACLLLVSCVALAGPPLREAPNLAAEPVNQLVVAGNACGPAAMLNAFRSGNQDWRRAADALAGDSDAARIRSMIRGVGMRPSAHFPKRTRWSRRGVNLADLRDMANELCEGQYLPVIRDEVFFLTSRETPDKLLKRVHKRLNASLAKGLPPVLSLRRYVRRHDKSGIPQWQIVDAHFVTLTALPRKLGKRERSFHVSYIDPWGGKRCEGDILIPRNQVLSNQAGQPACLIADFPQAGVGKKRIRKGEETALVVSAAIGRW